MTNAPSRSDDGAIRRGVQGGYLNLAVTWLVQLVMVPLLLHHLGAATWGLYAALTSVVGYFGLLTFGSSLTVPRYVADHAARGDHDALGRFVSTYFVAHIVVALAGLAAAFGLAPLLTSILDVPPELRPMIAPAFRLVVAGWALGLAAGLYQSLLTGLGEVHLANIANSVRTLLTLGAAGAVVAARGDLAMLLGALMIASLAGSIGLAVLVRVRHPEIPVAWRLAEVATLRATFRSAGYYFLMQVAALVVMGTDNIVISVFGGVEQVAPYAVAFQLWAMSLALLWSGVDVLMPFFTRWSATGDRAALNTGYLRATRLAFAGSVLAAILVATFGTSLIRWWVGESLTVDRRVLWVFSAMFLTATPIHTAALVLAALGKHRAPAIGGAVEAALNLGLTLALVRPLGILGVASGTLLSGALTNGWIAPLTACRELGIGLAAYLRGALLPSLLPAAAGGTLALLLARAAPAGVVTTLGAMLAVAVTFGAVFWFGSLVADERREIVGR